MSDDTDRGAGDCRFSPHPAAGQGPSGGRAVGHGRHAGGHRAVLDGGRVRPRRGVRRHLDRRARQGAGRQRPARLGAVHPRARRACRWSRDEIVRPAAGRRDRPDAGRTCPGGPVPGGCWPSCARRRALRAGHHVVAPLARTFLDAVPPAPSTSWSTGDQVSAASRTPSRTCARPGCSASTRPTAWRSRTRRPAWRPRRPPGCPMLAVPHVLPVPGAPPRPGRSRPTLRGDLRPGPVRRPCFSPRDQAEPRGSVGRDRPDDVQPGGPPSGQQRRPAAPRPRPARRSATTCTYGTASASSPWSASTRWSRTPSVSPRAVPRTAPNSAVSTTRTRSSGAAVRRVMPTARSRPISRGALEHRQREGVDDAERGDHHGERRAARRQAEQLVDLAALGVLELLAVLDRDHQLRLDQLRQLGAHLLRVGTRRGLDEGREGDLVRRPDRLRVSARGTSSWRADGLGVRRRWHRRSGLVRAHADGRLELVADPQ